MGACVAARSRFVQLVISAQLTGQIQRLWSGPWHVSLPAGRTQEPDAAVPVLVPAGSAVVMDPRVWHARGPNRSGVTRKALFYAYAYRWIRPRDQLTLSGERLAGLSLVERQLLGEGAGPESFHHPQEADIPLKSLAEEQSWPLKDTP